MDIIAGEAASVISNVSPPPPFSSCKSMGTGHTKRYVTSVELTEVGAEAMRRDSTRDQNHG